MSEEALVLKGNWLKDSLEEAERAIAARPPRMDEYWYA